MGRANHHVEGTPAGRLYPLTRDELVECTALLAAVRAGHLDLLHPPVAPLDVLAQQVVAEVAAAEEWEVDGLFALVRRAAPFAGLDREAFDQVVELASWGIQTGRGRRGAHLHHDAVNGRLRARRGARLAALTSGGAIPETGDYRVVLDPEGVTVGSVHEDFAVEATAGDIFLLGTHSWRVVKVETGTVRVVDAADLPPTIPFWLGEAPARTAELSAEVGDLRAALEPLLAAGDGDGRPGRGPRPGRGVTEEVADQVVAYLGAGLAALGALPTRDRLVIERVFDDAEGTQLIVHSPLRRADQPGPGPGAAQAVLRLVRLRAPGRGRRRHRRPLPRPAAQLPPSRGPVDAAERAPPRRPGPGGPAPPDARRPVAVEPQPGPRGPPVRGGPRRPIHLQRMEAEDMLAATWPALAACQENAPPGPVAVPDHVLVRQTVDDCLTEPLDADGLVGLLADLESGRVAVHFVESAEPSPLAHGILTGKPFTFLDGAPLEERRTRAVAVPRGLAACSAPTACRPGSRSHPASSQRSTRPPRPRSSTRSARDRATPTSSTTCCSPSSVAARCPRGARGSTSWPPTAGRSWSAATGPPTERRPRRGGLVRSLDRPDGRRRRGPGRVRGRPPRPGRTGDRGHGWSTRTSCRPGGPRRAGDRGPGAFRPGPPPGGGLGHRAARRALVRPAPAGADPRRQPPPAPPPGRGGAAWPPTSGSWPAGSTSPRARMPRGGPVCSRSSSSSRASRRRPASGSATCSRPACAGYDPRWLDELCLAGQVAWGRLTPRPDEPVTGEGDGAAVPPRHVDPVAGHAPGARRREDLGWTLAAVRAGREVVEPPRRGVGRPPGRPPRPGRLLPLRAPRRHRAARPRRRRGPVGPRLPRHRHRRRVRRRAGLLAARARARSAAAGAVRRPRPRPRRQRTAAGQRHRRGPVVAPARAGGHRAAGLAGPRAEELAEAVAWQLLARWGVVAWEVWGRESYRVPWRDVVRALRRLEARGQVLGGRFVAGISGEQYATPEAAALLSEVHRDPRRGAEVTVAGADPLNLTGGLLGGTRIPSVRHREVRYRAGVAERTDEPFRPPTLSRPSP